MRSREITAVVAAGGFATRCGSRRPKSLMSVEGTTLLEHSLAQLEQCGISRVLVFNNRREYNGELRAIAARWPSVAILEDEGVTSTFQLARTAARHAENHRICFLYGHAPRPASHIRVLLSHPEADVVVTRVERSSKRRVLHTVNGYLEPPYVFPGELVLDAQCSDWEQFWRRVGSRVAELPLSGPAEANTLSELSNYAKYVYTFISSLPGREALYAST